MILGFLWGISAFGAAVVALFFGRFYRLSRDRLFGYFAAAFAVLAIHWTVLMALTREHNASAEVYLLRLLAFVLIIVGIVDKNRSER